MMLKCGSVLQGRKHSDVWFVSLFSDQTAATLTRSRHPLTPKPPRYCFKHLPDKTSTDLSTERST